MNVIVAMTKVVATAVVFSFVIAPLVAAASQPPSRRSVFADDYAAADKLKDALRHRDMHTVADLIEYPFRRERPLSVIKNRTEFLQNSGDYFDAGTIKVLVGSKAEEIGWRGVQLAGGAIWFNNGRIIAINLQTDAYRKRFSDAKKAEGRSLYAAARGYDRIVFQCDTHKLHIRTQYYGKDLRYFAWEKGTPLTSKPRLMLASGAQDFQGSGGNYNLTFRNGAYRYQLEVANICGEDCNNYLSVFDGDKTISHQVCN